MIYQYRKNVVLIYETRISVNILFVSLFDSIRLCDLSNTVNAFMLKSTLLCQKDMWKRVQNVGNKRQYQLDSFDQYLFSPVFLVLTCQFVHFTCFQLLVLSFVLSFFPSYDPFFLFFVLSFYLSILLLFSAFNDCQRLFNLQIITAFCHNRILMCPRITVFLCFIFSLCG